MKQIEIYRVIVSCPYHSGNKEFFISVEHLLLEHHRLSAVHPVRCYYAFSICQIEFPIPTLDGGFLKIIVIVSQHYYVVVVKIWQNRKHLLERLVVSLHPVYLELGIYLRQLNKFLWQIAFPSWKFL